MQESNRVCFLPWPNPSRQTPTWFRRHQVRALPPTCSCTKNLQDALGWEYAPLYAPYVVDSPRTTSHIGEGEKVHF